MLDYAEKFLQIALQWQNFPKCHVLLIQGFINFVQNLEIHQKFILAKINTNKVRILVKIYYTFHKNMVNTDLLTTR